MNAVAVAGDEDNDHTNDVGRHGDRDGDGAEGTQECIALLAIDMPVQHDLTSGTVCKDKSEAAHAKLKESAGHKKGNGAHAEAEAQGANASGGPSESQPPLTQNEAQVGDPLEKKYAYAQVEEEGAEYKTGELPLLSAEAKS